MEIRLHGLVGGRHPRGGGVQETLRMLDSRLRGNDSKDYRSRFLSELLNVFFDG